MSSRLLRGTDVMLIAFSLNHRATFEDFHEQVELVERAKDEKLENFVVVGMGTDDDDRTVNKEEAQKYFSEKYPSALYFEVYTTCYKKNYGFHYKVDDKNRAILKDIFQNAVRLSQKRTKEGSKDTSEQNGSLCIIC